MYRINGTRSESGIAFSASGITSDGRSAIGFAPTATTDVATKSRFDAGR
jgi:hypothetical protein